MQIIDNKALLLKLRHPKQVLAAIPDSKPAGPNEVAVKWDVPQVHALRSMNIPAPSPIEGRYDWPGRYTPFDHQKKTAAFLTNHRRAFCLSEQGTGKTGAAIWAADFLMKRGLIKRALVICPMSIMDAAWRGDLFSFAMHRKVDIAHGSAAKRKQIIGGDAEFVIINYDGVEIVEKDIAAGGFDLMIVDECFVAGTPVLTPSGPRPIETLSAGDRVWTSAGAAHIKTAKSRVTTDVVELGLSDGQKIRCTGDHPLFTDVGWVAARDAGGRRLFSPAEVSHMRERLRGATFELGVAQGERHQQVCDLLEILRSEEVAPAEPGGVVFQTDEAGATRDLPRGGALQGYEGENLKGLKGSGSQAAASGRKRDRPDADGDFGAPAPAPTMGVELRRALGPEAARLSDQLQARLREPGAKNRVGDRRGLSYREGTERAGPEERGSAGGTWVDSVSAVECGSGTPVFNLEVEGTPNFYVGSGVLVHNCTAYKTTTTKRWKCLNRLVTDDTWLWMMTGTPAAQTPTDAYGLAKLVNPKGVPRHFGAFRDMLMYKVTQFKWTPKADAVDTVHRVLQPAIRFTKDECLDLPDLVYVKRHVELTKQQLKYYEQIRKHMVMEAAGEQVTAVNAAVKANKLLQVAAGAAYTDDGESLQFDIKNRYNVLKEVIDESAHKVLVFVPFQNTIEMLTERLRQDKITAEIINGGVSAGARADIFRRFQQSDDPRVLVIQPQAAAHGVTLTAADTIVWWAPTASLEIYAQANARIHRSGQKNKCTVVQLEGSPVERHIYKLLDNKIDVHSKILELYNNILD